jgi:hypothetical protein
MSGAVTCSITDCSRPAVSIWRLRPRRDREPICDAVKQAADWLEAHPEPTQTALFAEEAS